MGSRVSQIALRVSTALHGKLRVSQLATLNALNLHGPIRVSQLAVMIPMSAHRAFFMETLESDSSFLDLLPFSVELTVESSPEHNPFRPTIPENLIDLGPEYYDYARENQEIQREQHDITQAGDSTFPYQMFIQSHDKKLFNLGSLSRFYHADYGIIICRYVQFDEMIASGVAAPVGFIRQRGLTEWVVTNDISKSHPDLVVGISGPFILPPNKTFGWVIVDGPNLQVIVNDSETAEYAEAFSWSQTGTVSNTAEGKVIGRRVNAPTTNKILPGQMHIQLESYSLEQISTAIVEATATLSQAITALQADVNTLQSLTVLDETVATITRTLANLQTALTAESRGRRQSDTTINNRISNLNFATTGQLGNLASTLQNAIAAVQTTLASSISATTEIASQAQQAAEEALNRLNSFNLDSQINLLLSMLTTLETRAKGKFPLVDGSVPPNLMYLDSGELIYEETY